MRAWLPFFLLCAILTGCGNPRTPSAQFHAMDVTGIDYGRNFRLTDHTGEVRTLNDFHGKVVVLFFGYTHCPEICPTTLSDLSLAIKQLGKDGPKVQVLFITIDPERDTRELLAKYVPAFNPTFLGLYGDAATTAETAAEFHVTYNKQPAASGKGYAMDHTAGTFVFDRSGRLRLYGGYGQHADDFAHDIRLLLQEEGKSAWKTWLQQFGLKIP
jgi:protein SCO1